MAAGLHNAVLGVEEAGALRAGWSGWSPAAEESDLSGGVPFAHGSVSRDTTFRSVLDISVDVRRALEAQVSESPLLRTDKLARFRHPTLPGLADMQPATAGSCKLLAAARGKDA